METRSLSRKRLGSKNFTRSLTSSFVSLSLEEKQRDKLSISSSSKRVGKRKESLIKGLSVEEFDLYVTALRESDGFDVPHFPRCRAVVIQCAVGNMYHPDEFESFALKAIDYYMTQVDQSADLTFSRVVKTNIDYHGSVRVYYLTFEARDVAAHGQLKTYQAKLFKMLNGDVSVAFCRLKPTAA